MPRVVEVRSEKRIKVCQIDIRKENIARIETCDSYLLEHHKSVSYIGNHMNLIDKKENFDDYLIAFDQAVALQTTFYSKRRRKESKTRALAICEDSQHRNMSFLHSI